ncbi:FecR domain-containing protein [Gilvimarinus agarilyticus]|uniref:FecR family protein n=1 Tax=Reichenbachiella agariperforans TaxID=156994 RepID=UPI001C0A00AE|nr:FecR family protein [Reichenbachiella agariperforans]MBU2884742.1 FecR domain-containing protein [Gilvimarinus agarilyticus]MBU2914936.1 FecR domain-containing protein [Reichenbachiella agariperforans]
MEQLISKYLKNELTNAEAQELKRWLEKDALNRKVFENIVSEWHLSAADVSSAKDRVMQQVRQTAVVEPVQHRTTVRRWMSYSVRIAAVLVLAAGLVFIWLTRTGIRQDDAMIVQQEIVYIEKEAAYGQKLTFELPDGSVVKLNAGSKLTYPKTFASKTREVSLTGEAFFDVARDEKKPFRISSNDVMVQVLGTSFNVRSYPEEENIAVAVKTGKVAVSSRVNQNQVILKPAEMALYSADDQSLNKKIIDDNELSVFGWTDQNLVLEDANFDVILTTLSRWYGVEFDVAQLHGAQKQFTANFKNPSLTKVMESLSFAYEFDYEIDGKKVTIY